MDFKWRLCDDLSQREHLDEDDNCIYAREKIREGYTISDSNQLIFNLKKPISYRGKIGYHYKGQAIRQFVKELLYLNLPECAVIAPAPTSKTVEHEEYDSILIETVELLQKERTDLVIEVPIITKKSMKSSHCEGGSRNPDYIIPNLQWCGYQNEAPDCVYLIDDVITSGGHFKAFKRLIQRHSPQTDVVGIFWAMTVST